DASLAVIRRGRLEARRSASKCKLQRLTQDLPIERTRVFGNLDLKLATMGQSSAFWLKLHGVGADPLPLSSYSRLKDNRYGPRFTRLVQRPNRSTEHDVDDGIGGGVTFGP